MIDISNKIKNLKRDLELEYVNDQYLYDALIDNEYVITKTNGLEKVKTHNQALAIVGDAALRLILSERLYRTGYDARELNRLRQEIECNFNLEIINKKINLIKYTSSMVVKKGEEYIGEPKENRVSLATTMEALLGAIYLTLADNNENLDKLIAFINKHI